MTGHAARAWRRGLPRLFPRFPPTRRFFSGFLPLQAYQPAQGPGCRGSSKPIAGSVTSQSLRSVRDPGFWMCRSTWNRAGINTLRCLVGCTIGDFSALWMLQTYHPGLGMGMIMGVSSKSCPFPSHAEHGRKTLTEQHSGLWNLDFDYT